MSIQQRFMHHVQPLLLILLLCGYSTAYAAPAPVIMVLGDSLSAAYGIDEQQGWAALLQQRLKQQGHLHQVVNISISGDTTQGGLSRLPAALNKHQPNILILALGANDGLRGSSITAMQQNLTQMVMLAKQHHSTVLLVGMELPPNYGSHYAQRFRESFRQIHQQQQVTLLPFLLAPIAQQRKYYQADELHPTAKAQPLLLEGIWSHLQPLL